MVHVKLYQCNTLILSKNEKWRGGSENYSQYQAIGVKMPNVPNVYDAVPEPTAMMEK